MKHTTVIKSLSRGITSLIIIAIVAAMAMGQNVVIGSSGTFSGTSGQYYIKGNITNSGVAAAKSIAGTVTLNGAAGQSVGTVANGAINFETLNVTPTVVATTTLNVASSVSTAVNIGTAGVAATLAVGTNTLTIGGTSALVNASSALTTASGSTVNYSSTSAGQVILGGFTYNGNLTLSGGATKTFNAGTLTSVGQAFDATAAGVVTLSGTALTLGTSGSFGALLNSATINNGSGLTQFGAMTNTGTIDGTIGAGALTCNSTVGNNGGTIKGGAALATFSGLLTQTASGVLTSGAGGLTFTAGLTNTSGDITVGASQSMAVSGGQFSHTAGTLTFNATSTVTYGASATTIVDAPYGNLTLNADAKSWALAAPRTVSGNLTLGSSAATNVTGANDLTVLGNISLSSNLTKAANAMLFTNASSAVSGTGYEIIGSVTRTHAFAASAYTFNNASTIVTPSTVGSLSSFTITSQPSTNPTNYLAGNTVNRTFHASYTGAGFTASFQLAYLGTEYTGLTPEKMKDFQGGITKPTKLSGAYTRSSANGFNYTSIAALTDAALTSGSELALDDRFNAFRSIAATAWDVATTWDATAVPTSADDVEIDTKVTVPDGVNAAASSVLINDGATRGLTVGAGASGSLAVGTGGLTNNNSTGTGLTVATGASVTITNGVMSNNGAISNDGTIRVE